MMIPDLNNIVLEFAQIKRSKNRYLNYCNRCYKYKCEKMKNIDILFYQIKLTFILEKIFHGGDINAEFQEIIQRSDIQPFKNENNDIIKTSGWVANSIDIENYWFKLHNLKTVEDIIMYRSNYLEFVNENFEFLEERNINFCDKCWLDGKKIKLD